MRRLALPLAFVAVAWLYAPTGILLEESLRPVALAYQEECGGIRQDGVVLGCPGIRLSRLTAGESFVNLAALLASASSQDLRAADADILDPDGGNWMVLLWFYRETEVATVGLSEAIASKIDAVGDGGYNFNVLGVAGSDNDTARLTIVATGGALTTLTGAVTAPGAWHYICGGQNVSNNLLVVNAEAPVTGTTRVVPSDTSPVVLGYRGDAANFRLDGRVSTWGFWKGGDGATEALCDLGYNGGIAPQASQLEAVVGVAPSEACDLNETSGTRTCLNGTNFAETNGPIGSAEGPPRS